DPGVAAGPRGSRPGYFIVRIAQRRDALVGAAQDRRLPGPAGLADVHSAAAAGLRGAVRRGAVAGGGCAAVVRVGLAAEGAADGHSGGGRYCGVSGDAGGQWYAHEACAQVARGAANQVTSCSAPALRAWEGRAPARPQSRGGGAACCAVSHRGRCSYTKHIGEARTPRRSTRPGCECQPAAELPATRFAPRAVLLHETYRRSPNPP